MNKENYCECLNVGHSMKIVGGDNNAIIMVNDGSAYRIYYVVQGNWLNELSLDSFVVRDVTANENGNAVVISEYDKKKKCLCILKSMPTRKLQLLMYTELGLGDGNDILEFINKYNMDVDGEKLFKFESICTCFDFVVNAPLGRKPEASESVVSVVRPTQDTHTFEIRRGNGVVKAYRVEKDTRTKNEKRNDKQNGDKIWTCSGFRCTEL